MHKPTKISVPELNHELKHDSANPDPFVMRVGNRYYCYTSAYYGVKILESRDLLSFTECGYAYCPANEKSFWAPAAFQWEGKYYLYYSSLMDGETDEHKHFLRVAVSERPEGPYTYLNTLTDYFAIDPHVVRSGERYYIFYAANIASNEVNGRIGTVIWVDELLAPDRMAGRNKTVLLPTIDEEIFARNRFGDGKDWHTLEGPFYLSDGVHSWLMYSGNAYTSPDYFIGYAQAEYREDLCELQFVKLPKEDAYHPLVRAGNGIEGTGHNSVTQGPDHITPVIVYHGRLPGGRTDDSGDDRVLFTDRIWKCKKELLTDAPSLDGMEKIKDPDIHFLEHLGCQRASSESGRTVLEPGEYELVLPEGQDIYIEISGNAAGEGMILMLADSETELLRIKGGWQQHAGVFFHKGRAHVRYGEEWRPPVFGTAPKRLILKVKAVSEVDYIDGTFWQGASEGEPECLL